jgi:hypothetical protein
VRLVARDGWRLLGEYRFDVERGLWRHRLGPVEPPLRLSQVSYESGAMWWPRHHDTAPESALEGYLAEAREILAGATPYADEPPRGLTEHFETLRWFELPAACLD